MTLDEAIEHAKEKGKGASKCAKDHRQLAKWLIEFQKIAKPKTDDENELKFYYVESLDDYWVGRRLDNFYYATWHGRLGFVWSYSKYLPWGEHVVDENTLWKEHTYPSEPIEIPFTEWIVGFVKKYSAEPKTGRWSWDDKGYFHCDRCGKKSNDQTRVTDFCPNCGADMRSRHGASGCPMGLNQNDDEDEDWAIARGIASERTRGGENDADE